MAVLDRSASGMFCNQPSNTNPVNTQYLIEKVLKVTEYGIRIQTTLETKTIS